MKAALEIWGADSNLFHQGFAKETNDPAIVAATTARPGTVLRRPVGTDGAVMEKSELPKNLAKGPVESAPHKQAARPVKAAMADDATARRASKAFDRQQRKREEA